jgi:hypothetical protein
VEATIPPVWSASQNPAALTHVADAPQRFLTPSGYA